MVIGLSVALLAGVSSSAWGARPASHAEVMALQSGARSSPLFGSRASSVQIVRACVSTVERGFAAVILHVPGDQLNREITLFHRNPHLRPVWRMYGFGSPQNLWFARNPANPYATRLRAERDLKASCRLPVWATKA